MQSIFPHDGVPDRMLVLHWPSGLRKSLPKIPADTDPDPSLHYPAVLVAIDDATKLDARMREAASSIEPGGTLLIAYPKSGAKGFSSAPRRPDLLAALESHAFTLHGRNHPLNDSWTALCAGAGSDALQEKPHSVSKSKPTTKKKKDMPANAGPKVQSMTEPTIPTAAPTPADIVRIRVEGSSAPLAIAMRRGQTFYQLHERLRDALNLSTDTFAFLGGGLPIDNPLNAPPAPVHRNASLTALNQSPAPDLFYCAGFGRDGWLSRYAIHIES